MATKDDIRSQALELPEPERVELARDLLLSVDGSGQPMDGDRSWAAELERRLHGVLDGSEPTLSSDEAHARVREALRDVNRK